MILNALPDLLTFQRQTRLTADLKSRLEQTSREAVTGRREDIAQAVNGDVGSVHLLEKALNDIKVDSRINALSGARIDLMSSSLRAVRGVVNGLDITALAALTIPDDFGIGTVSKQAEANLRSVMSLLSTTHGSRKLFSGDATDQIPLANPDTLLADITSIMQIEPDADSIEIALDVYFNDPDGGFAQNIYQGGDGTAPPSFLADGSSVEFAVKANDQALRDTLRGLAVLATAQNTQYDIKGSEFSDVFSSGASILGKGMAAVIKIEGNLGVSAGLIENANTQQAAEQLIIGQALNAVIGRDQFEAAAELKQLEAQLEASYLVTSRLANLSLTNFIR